MTEDARFTYYVVLHEGGWRIRYGDQLTEAYATQRDAIGAAVWAGHEFSRRGRSTQVLVQGPDGRLQSDWTYDYHPEDPRG